MKTKKGSLLHHLLESETKNIMMKNPRGHLRDRKLGEGILLLLLIERMKMSERQKNVRGERHLHVVDLKIVDLL